MSREIGKTSVFALIFLLSCCSAGNGSEQDGTGERERGKEPPALRGKGGVHPSPIAGSWYPKDPEALRRLIAGGLIDLAIEYALLEARRKEGHGLDPVESDLLAALTNGGASAHLEKARSRFEELRGLRPPPAVLGPLPYDQAPERPWPSAETLAAEAQAELETSTGGDFDARLARARTLARLQLRPDVLTRLP